ncbi:MAG: hypothetical protein HC843_07895 [Sphingomonadales bacterium]|nr:hypothetical protein [Sphingomonadales bacterium]
MGLSALLMASAAVPAMAQDEATEESASEFSVSGSAAVTSDYRFRGLSQSGGDFAIQGSVGLTHDNGFYIGTWGSSVNFAGGTEIDVYGGWSKEVASGLTVDVGLLYYIYPDAGSGPANTDFFEPYAKVSTTLGPVEGTLGVAYAWGGQTALSDSSNIYVSGDLSSAIPGTPLTATAHLGYSEGDSALSTLKLGDNNYIDWSIGLDYAITDKLTFGVKYTDTDDSPAARDFTDTAVLATLGVSF